MLAYLMFWRQIIVLAASLQCNFEVGQHRCVGVLEVTKKSHICKPLRQKVQIYLQILVLRHKKGANELKRLRKNRHIFFIFRTFNSNFALPAHKGAG